MSEQAPSRRDLISELIGSTWSGEATARAIPRPAPSEPRPALRAKTVPRNLNETRARARLVGAIAIDNACRRHGVSSGRIAAALGQSRDADRQGDEVRSGAIPVTLGEQLLLLPIEVAIDAVAELLLHRCSSAPFADGEKAVEALSHVQALRRIVPPTTR